jgi:bifunctional non-homologous end joining protein LigD
LPKVPQAQLATLVDAPPTGDDWLHEIKFDGYRMLCVVDAGRARFISRNGQDWTAKFPTLTAAARKLDAKQLVIDGEVVALDEHGASRFQLLQNAFREHRVPLYFYVFDLLYCSGYDLTPAALEDRKRALQALVGRGQKEMLRYSEHIVGSGEKLLAEASRLGLEGIISKRRDAPYRAGRGGDWLKSKCKLEQEFVIAGYSDPGGSRTKFGSLLVGYYERGKLTYAGRVGTGFSERTLRDLGAQFDKLARKTNPFEGNAAAARGRDVHWLEPKLVAQIEFAQWTEEGLLRQPSFQGLREDKPATAVRRERPQAAPVRRRAKTRS